ncbi:type II restriction endonuclease [Acidimicrobiaceae bacterium]|nr:type II restriction endonuclease [Acidimicrobiaceae bacterium]
MSTLKDEITDEVKNLKDSKQFKAASTEKISQLIFKELEKEYRFEERNEDFIIDNFSNILKDYRDLDWEILQRHLKPKYLEMFKHIVDKHSKDNDIKENELLDFVLNDSVLFDYKYQLDQSLTQSYKSRSGKSFEYILQFLFDKIGYEYTAQNKNIEGKPDFLFPSIKEYIDNPSKCLIIGAKTKVRERYKQIVTEGNKDVAHFCFTLGEDLQPKKIQNGKALGLTFVVPKNIKEENNKEDNLYSFEEFLLNKLSIYKK